MTCPKCGHDMRIMPEREYQLFEIHTIDAICPSCLHVERLDYIALREE